MKNKKKPVIFCPDGENKEPFKRLIGGNNAIFPN